MRLNQYSKPGTLVRFTGSAYEGTLSYGLTIDGLPLSGEGRRWHEFSSKSTGMFISPSRNAPRACGIVLVGDKLLFVNYDEISELTKSP